MAGVLLQAGYLGGVWAAIKLGMPAGLTALIVGMQPILTAACAPLSNPASAGIDRRSREGWWRCLGWSATHRRRAPGSLGHGSPRPFPSAPAMGMPTPAIHGPGAPPLAPPLEEP